MTSVQISSQHVMSHNTCSCECIRAFLQLAPDAMSYLCYAALGCKQTRSLHVWSLLFALKLINSDCFLAFIQHVLNLSMGVHTYSELVHLLCFAVTNASTQQVLLLRILSFRCWMPKKIWRFLKSQYGSRQDSSAAVFRRTDCVLSSLFLLRSSVVEVREAVGAMAWMLWALWSNCINNLWTLTSVALWPEFESDPSVWCTRELVLKQLCCMWCDAPSRP